MITKVPTWDDAVAAWLQRCDGDGLTASSVKNYSDALLHGRMPAFRASHGINIPADLTADVLETLKGELRTAGLRPASVAHALRALKTFAHFCVDAGWIEDAAVLRVQLPKQPKRAPDVFTDRDLQKLLAACVCERDRVIVELAVDTGLRRGEMVRLDVEDVVSGPAGWLVRVRQGKGQKDRTVPVSDVFAEKLERYLANVRPPGTDPAMFLTTKRVANGEYQRLTADALYRVWNRIGKAAGIRAYPHKGRHSFATRAAQDGVAPWAIQGALGHSSLEMTERYVRVAAVDLSGAFAKGRAEAGGTRLAAKVTDIRRRLEERSPAPYWLAEFLPAAVAKSYIRALTSVALAFSKHSRIDGAELASLIATAMSIQSRTDGAAGIDEAAVAILESIGY